MCFEVVCFSLQPLFYSDATEDVPATLPKDHTVLPPNISQYLQDTSVFNNKRPGGSMVGSYWSPDYKIGATNDGQTGKSVDGEVEGA